MVALLVVALALAALVGTAGRSATDTAHLRDRTVAGWVAQNVITDLRLEHGRLVTGGQAFHFFNCDQSVL